MYFQQVQAAIYRVPPITALGLQQNDSESYEEDLDVDEEEEFVAPDESGT